MVFPIVAKHPIKTKNFRSASDTFSFSSAIPHPASDAPKRIHLHL
jgi:hypothetical protein